MIELSNDSHRVYDFSRYKHDDVDNIMSLITLSENVFFFFVINGSHSNTL